ALYMLLYIISIFSFFYYPSMTSLSSFYFLYLHRNLRDLHSFPTRRSSDLAKDTIPPSALESSTLNPSPFIPILTSPCTTFNFPDTISLSLDDTLVTNCPNDNSCLSFAQATLSFRQTFTSKIYSLGIFSMFGQSMTSSCFVCGKTLNE